MRKIEIKNKLLVLMILAFMIQIITFVYYESHLYEVVDRDFAKNMRQAIEMGRNHKLFLDGWIYFTNTGHDQPNTMAAMFFAVVGDIFTSYFIVGIIDLLIFIYVTHRILDNIGVDYDYQLLWIMLVFTPYCYGALEYSSMLFYAYGAYAHKTIIPILLVALLSSSKAKSYSFYGMLFFYGIFLLATSISSQIYVAVCGLIPVAICVVVFWSLGFMRDIKKRIVGLWMYSGMIILTGLLIRYILGLTTTASVNTFALCSPTDIEPITKNLGTLIGLVYNPSNGTPVFSIQGMKQLMNLCILVFFFTFGVISVKNVVLFLRDRKEMKEEKWRCVFTESSLIILFIFNELILFLIGSTERYHLMGVVPLMGCACINCRKYIMRDKGRLYKSILGFVICCIMAQGILAGLDFYKDYRHLEDKNRTVLEQVINVAKERNIGTIYFMGDNLSSMVEQIRVFDYDRNYQTLSLDGDNYSFWNYYYYSQSIDRSAFTDRNAIVIRNEENSIDDLPGEIASSYVPVEILGEAGRGYTYTVYLSETNKFDGLTGFPVVDKATDLPSSKGITIKGETEEHGWLVTNEEGIVLSSPGLWSEGNMGYRVQLSYKCENADQAFFEIYRNMELMESSPLDPDEDVVYLEIPKEKGEYIYAVRNMSSSDIIVKSIDYYTL